MDRKTVSGWLLGIATVLVSIIATASVAVEGGTQIRWDLISFQPPNLQPGGVAGAQANDGSQIVLTGSGTFVVGESSTVTGGGTWATAGPIGSATGTYEVNGLVRFQEAPGTLPLEVIDHIGDPADARSGLAVLRITYSDGSRGILVVSCHLPVGTPDTIFEGITATKGFVDFFDRVPPVAGVDAHRTVFHILEAGTTSAGSEDD